MYEQDGRDFRLSLDTTVAGISFNVEQRVVDDQSYMSIPGRPWRLDPAVSGKERAPTLSDALRSVEAAGPEGTATIDGVVAGRFVLDGLEPARLTAALGLSNPGVKLTDPTTAFFASAEGEPVALDLRYTVSATDGAPGTSILRLTFEMAPDQVSIAAPDDLWVAKPDGHGYAIWYPATWVPELKTAEGGFTDTFTGPDASGTVFCVHDSKLDLEQWAADGVGFYTKQFEAKPDSSSDSTLGATPVKVTTWKSGTVDGQKRSITSVALVQEPTACDIQWFAAAGSTSEDDDRFEAFLATFALE
jgi:hypothetical protein